MNEKRFVVALSQTLVRTGTKPQSPMRPRQRFDRRIKHAIAASSVCGPAPVFYRLDAKVNAGRHGLHRAPQSYAGRTPVRGRGRRSPTGPRLPRPPRRRRQAPQDLPLRHAPRTRRWGPGASARLKSFESSVVLSRKGFRLGKFVQSLRAHPHLPPALALLAYGSEGVYYFVEQFVWIAKAGLLPAHLLPRLQRLSAWAELLGYVGSILIKLEEVAKIESSIKKRLVKDCDKESEAVKTMQGKLLLKRMSVVQDVADAVMALGDVTDGKGLLGSSTLMAAAGLLSALISTHKNWNSC